MTAKQLLAWRQRLDLTQKEAAEAIGCGLRSLQQWEGGVNAIPKYIALAALRVEETQTKRRTS